jgi:hypothetical protein
MKTVRCVGSQEPRTQIYLHLLDCEAPFHGGNTGSNPLGNASYFNTLRFIRGIGVLFVSRRSVGDIAVTDGLLLKSTL